MDEVISKLNLYIIQASVQDSNTITVNVEELRHLSGRLLAIKVQHEAMELQWQAARAMVQGLNADDLLKLGEP